MFFEHGIRVAIIGTGWGIKVQVPQFRLAGINIFALCSRDQKRCVQAACYFHISTAAPHDLSAGIEFPIPLPGLQKLLLRIR